jgi:uncharacterized protein (DUF924 family)
VTPSDVLDFWFSDRARPMWWSKNDDFDAEIRPRFGALVDEASAGAHGDWTTQPSGALALVIVLDQFPRNMFRGSPRAFAGDARALEIARATVESGLDTALALEQRQFLYMPFQHSEVLADQDRSIELFTRWVADHDEAARAAVGNDLTYAHRHRDIIQRFHRFPHRNAVLGRTSTPDEIAFLREPNSSF